MPIVTRVFTPVLAVSEWTPPAPSQPAAPASPQLPAATIKQLHGELAAIGLPVVGTESGDIPQFGTATSAQLKTFQNRYKLPVTGNLDSTTGGVLSLSALVATETNRAKLRTELANMTNSVPDSPEYNYWFARYALMAGDYNLAARVRPSPFTDLLGNGLENGVFTTGDGNPQPQQPDVSFPENFYSYRYSLMAQEDIDALRQLPNVSSGTNSPRIALRPTNGTGDTFDPPHQPLI
jgi:hypothetical protein